eukprot:5098209-Amphidinium_carterae.1
MVQSHHFHAPCIQGGLGFRHWSLRHPSRMSKPINLALPVDARSPHAVTLPLSVQDASNRFEQAARHSAEFELGAAVQHAQK